MKCIPDLINCQDDTRCSCEYVHYLDGKIRDCLWCCENSQLYLSRWRGEYFVTCSWNHCNFQKPSPISKWAKYSKKEMSYWMFITQHGPGWHWPQIVLEISLDDLQSCTDTYESPFDAIEASGKYVLENMTPLIPEVFDGELPWWSTAWTWTIISTITIA